MCNERRGSCWPRRRPIWYGIICGCLYHLVYLGQKSLAEPIPLQAVDHSRNSAWSRTCELKSSRIIHPGRWLHRGSSYAHTQMPCQHPSLWLSWTGVQGSRRLYTPNINNKGCTRNHLSFWSYVLVCVGRSSCQQLTNDSIQKRKASLVVITAPGNKISKARNKGHQSMFSNNLMTALVTLKTIADQ